MLPRFLLLFTVIVWGWTFVATKICLEYLTPLELIGLRFMIALPVLMTILLFKKIKLEFGAQKWSLGLGAAIITVHFLIQITGIKYTSATNTGWIISVTPLVMALLAVLILKEKITRMAVFGIAVATIGILLLVSKGEIGNFDWLSSVCAEASTSQSPTFGGGLAGAGLSAYLGALYDYYPQSRQDSQPAGRDLRHSPACSYPGVRYYAV